LLLGDDRAAAWTARARTGVTIHLAPNRLRRLTCTHRTRTDLFPFLRESLFTELGVPLPDLALLADPDLADDVFAVGFAGVRGLPSVGLPADRLLVNGLPEDLRALGVTHGTLTDNAGGGRFGAIVPATDADLLASVGYPTWNDIDHLVLVVAATLRRHASWLVDAEVTDLLLGRLADDYPTLVRLARQHIPLKQVTEVLRALLADGIPVRDLVTILERLVENAFDASDRRDPVTAVRAGLAGAIAHRVAGGARTVGALLLDPAFAPLLHAADGADEARTRRLLVDGLRAELTYLPATARTPVVLVPDDLRAPVQRHLREAAPSVAVVSYGELPPELTVHPLARITLRDVEHVEGTSTPAS
jgi:type III secretion protein V